MSKLDIRKFIEVDENSLIKEIAKEFEVDEVYDEDEIVEWVADNKHPEEVFSEKKLIEWAENNGFTR